MTTQVNSRLHASFKNISQTAGICAVAVGCLVLVGWQFDLPAKTSPPHTGGSNE